MKVLSVPFKNSVGQEGCVEAPDKILEDAGITVFKEISFNGKKVADDMEKIYEVSAEAFKSKENCVFVGGDHSITFPTFSAFNENYKDAFLIVFDAHADSDNPADEPTNEEWLRAIVESGFDAKKIILIGTRKVWLSEKDFLAKSGIKIFSEIEDFEAVADYITEKVIRKSVYVSVDMDAIDSAFAPGVNMEEPNGLMSRDFFYLLRRIFKTRSVKALDVTEVNPIKDEKYDYRTVKLASKIVQDYVGL